MGVFVEITIDETRFASAAERDACVESCPVGIYDLSGERVVTISEREDECILCGLCLAAAPTGAVSVRRRYGDHKPVAPPST